jgi:CheY-like chemotaxis protein
MTGTGSYRQKILVVEDEPIIGRLCRRILNAEGYDVDVAENGFKAIEIAGRNDYDLCVSDIKMPGITGIQLYKHWQEGKLALVKKTIFITGDVMNKETREFLSKSGRSCVLKPFTPQELVTAVKEALKQKSGKS